MIFLELVPEEEAAWTLQTYHSAAEALGIFNGAYLAGRPRPDFPWMLPGRVNNWLEQSSDAICRLRAEAGEPILAARSSEGTLDRTLELWRRRDELVSALRTLPRGTPSESTDSAGRGSGRSSTARRAPRW